MSRLLNTRVAVSAVHSELASMQSVAVLNGLLRHIPYVGIRWSEIIPEEKDGEHTSTQGGNERYYWQQVRSPRKYLRHSVASVGRLVKTVVLVKSLKLLNKLR